MYTSRACLHSQARLQSIREEKALKLKLEEDKRLAAEEAMQAAKRNEEEELARATAAAEAAAATRLEQERLAEEERLQLEQQARVRCLSSESVESITLHTMALIGGLEGEPSSSGQPDGIVKSRAATKSFSGGSFFASLAGEHIHTDFILAGGVGEKKRAGKTRTDSFVSPDIAELEPREPEVSTADLSQLNQVCTYPTSAYTHSPLIHTRCTHDFNELMIKQHPPTL